MLGVAQGSRIGRDTSGLRVIGLLVLDLATCERCRPEVLEQLDEPEVLEALPGRV